MKDRQGQHGPEPVYKTAEELAELIRPIKFEAGFLYQLKDAPVEQARRILVSGHAPTIPGNVGTLPEFVDEPKDNVAPQWIIGVSDDRTQVTNTGSYPYRARGHWSNSGTGTMLGARAFWTAAHLFYDYDSSPPAWRNIGVFMPGRGSSSYKPWGEWTVYTFYIPTAYITTGSPSWDYAVGDLTIAPGYTGSPGWYGSQEISTGSMNNYCYHGDKPFGTQWVSAGTVTSTVGAIYRTTVDILPGCSGAGLKQTYASAYNLNSVLVFYAMDGAGNKWNEYRKWDTSTYEFARDWSSAY